MRKHLCLLVIFAIIGTIISISAEQTYMLNSEFDSLENWTVNIPDGSLVASEQMEDSRDGNVLHILGAANNTYALYGEAKKYYVDYQAEFRLKIARNEGTIIVNLYPGTERTQINITSGGNRISVPVQNGPTDTKVNKTAIITDYIEDYDSAQWHDWKVVEKNHIQTITVDGVEIFSDYTQNPWNNNFNVQFWSNSNNEYYVDYVTFMDNSEQLPDNTPSPTPTSEPGGDVDIDLHEVELTYGKSKNIISGGMLDSELLITNSNGENMIAEYSDGSLRLERSGDSGDYVYANYTVTSPGSKMVLDFDLQVSSFSKENTIMLRNNDCRVQVMYFKDKIQYRNESGGVTAASASIGNAKHHWTYVLQDKYAQIYMDGKIIANYRTHDVTSSAILQFVVNNNTNTTAGMTVSNISLKNITGSFIIDSPVMMYGERHAQGAEPGENLTVALDYENYSTQSSPLTLIAAAYNEDGKLLSIKAQKQPGRYISRGTNTVLMEIPQKTCYIKVFAWKDTIYKEPLAAEQTLN